MVRMASEASSVRGIQRRYGVAREIIAREIKAGRLPASRIGERRYLVLHRDFERWLSARAVRPAAHAEAVAQRVLERRAGAA